MRDTNSKESHLGVISALQRFSVHDGPGIRTLVFMKGCPLRCLWCGNPETQLNKKVISWRAARCSRCGECAKACPANAIKFSKRGQPRINRKSCAACGLCAEACPSGAMRVIGQKISVEELLSEIEKDIPFYRNSGGGVTVGGGEPTLQAQFVSVFLKKCKMELGINTAVETCGYARFDSLKQTIMEADLIYYDIKHVDSVKHHELTGVLNDLIIGNLRKISQEDRQIIIRIPVIPGYNDSEDSLRETGKLITGLGKSVKKVELLPYHNYGTSKYHELGRRYKLKSLEPPTKEQLLHLQSIIENFGIDTEIGA